MPAKPSKKPALKGRVFEVTCIGEYYGQKNMQHFRASYSITRRMGEKAYKAGFLSVFRNFILNNDDPKNLAKLREQYPYWERFRTHFIDTAVEITNKNMPLTDLALMNRNQLVKYIDQKGLPVDAELYPLASDLRQALKDFKGNRDAFLKAQEKRRARYGDSLAVERELKDLVEYEPSDDENASGSQPAVAKLRELPLAVKDDDLDEDDRSEVRIQEIDDADELDELLDSTDTFSGV
jgi:hypothetical protein